MFRGTILYKLCLDGGSGGGKQVAALRDQNGDNDDIEAE